VNYSHYERSKEDKQYGKLERIGGVHAKYEELRQIFGKSIDNEFISWSLVGKGNEKIIIYNNPNDNEFSKDDEYFWSISGNGNARNDIFLILKWITLKLVYLRKI
jgi:hypothetical protein